MHHLLKWIKKFLKSDSKRESVSRFRRDVRKRLASLNNRSTGADEEAAALYLRNISRILENRFKDSNEWSEYKETR